MSQPKTHSPIDVRSSRGMSPLFSIVRYEMHRLESRMYSSAKAFVGQAVRQRVHVPQLTLLAIESAGIGSSVRISARKNQDPRRGSRRFVFLPKKPRPALVATARSRSGTASTKQRDLKSRPA